jgi:uncharacterized membrane protein YphA (DoxX/SURF4 family)
MKTFRRITAWALQILMTVAFVSIGLGKFGNASWERSFERWGYPPGSHLIVGGLEMTAGALLIVPRVSSYAALLLAAVMVGAMTTHGLAGQPIWRPAPHLTILLLLAWLRWPSRWRRSTAAPAAARTTI